MSPLISGPIPAAVTREEMRAALAVFVRALAPSAGITAPGTGAEAFDEDEDGCGCGGSDDSGLPYCNHGGGCSCAMCLHYDHVKARHCSVSGCGQQTRYRIVGWCTHRNGVWRAASAGDPDAVIARDGVHHGPDPTSRSGQVSLGDSVQRHRPGYACTTQHAAEVIRVDRMKRVESRLRGQLSASNTYYEVKRWDYEPDEIDVPGALLPLLANLESAAFWAKATLSAVGGGRPPGPEYTTGACGAALVWALRFFLDHQDQQHAAAEAVADWAEDE